MRNETNWNKHQRDADGVMIRFGRRAAEREHAKLRRVT